MPALSHLQSELKGNKIKVGVPVAPDKWAVELSTETTQSQQEINAANPSKSLNVSKPEMRKSSMPRFDLKDSTSWLVSPY